MEGSILLCMRPLVEMYTATGCHLCDVARGVVYAAQRQVAFDVREVDIRSDPTLLAEHRLSIPVITVNGQTVAHHHVELETLVAAVLQAGGTPVAREKEHPEREGR
jgi:hypothetical protein